MMKSHLLLPLFLCFIVFQNFAAGQNTDRKDLHDLIDLRREKFDSYSRSIEKKSGFFGNKTKKDIQHSNDVLTEIVETDNRIIGLLNRVVDFKSYEKVNRNYDLLQNDERLNNLRQATDTLTKQVDTLVITNASLKSKTKKLQWLLFILSALLIWSLVSRRRKKVSEI